MAISSTTARGRDQAVEDEDAVVVAAHVVEEHGDRRKPLPAAASVPTMNGPVEPGGSVAEDDVG